MNCVIVVETSCCTNNCSKAEPNDSSLDEYEANCSEEETEEEELDNMSTKTLRE